MGLVIFDIDGTIVDSQNGILEAQRTAFASQGLAPPTPERSLSIVGLSLTQAFTVLVGADGPVEALSAAYRVAWQDLRASGRATDPLYPGAEQALQTLKQRGFRLAVATGKSRRGMAHLIDRYGWRDLFDTIQTADGSPSKPAPDMILRALEESDTHPTDAVMIGDTSYDMLMARAAGVRSIGVTWGYHGRSALLDAGAEITVDDFDGLIRQLRP